MTKAEIYFNELNREIPEVIAGKYVWHIVYEDIKREISGHVLEGPYCC